MQFRPLETGIEVNGQTVYSIVDGFSLFKQAASQVLAEEGIGSLDDDGLIRIDREGWYSQEAWLRAFERITRIGGDNVLFRIGRKIPENAKFPPWVKDVVSALRSIDVAYHMNHRKQGRPMFDMTSGKMTEGIGHYAFMGPDDTREVTVKCDNPYPCDFDRGIIVAMVQRFDPSAVVTHAASKLCRKHGDAHCTYTIKW